MSKGVVKMARQLPSGAPVWDREQRGEATQPFRLWDAKNRIDMRWRYYTTEKRAKNGALLEVRWLQVGASIEVYDVRTGRLCGQYTRRVNSVDFTE